MLNRLLIKLITFYQRSISPDHSWVNAYFPNGYCRYTPSCSEYAKQSLYHHGTVKGLYLSFKRILKCNPYAGFGPDPVPGLTKTGEQRTQNS